MYAPCAAVCNVSAELLSSSLLLLLPQIVFGNFAQFVSHCIRLGPVAARGPLPTRAQEQAVLRSQAASSKVPDDALRPLSSTFDP